MVSGLDLSHSTMNLDCKVCIQGKQHKTPFSSGIAIKQSDCWSLCIWMFVKL